MLDVVGIGAGLGRRDPDRPSMLSSDDIVERILFWLALAGIVWLIGGLTVAPLLS